jgi:hypothetical protein
VYINENYIPFSKSLKAWLRSPLLFFPHTMSFSVDRKPYVYSPARYVGTVSANLDVFMRCEVFTVSTLRNMMFLDDTLWKVNSFLYTPWWPIGEVVV